MKKNWFITGGCGFIGTTLISHLLEREKAGSITVFDNLSSGSLDDLRAVALHAREAAPAPGSVALIRGDIRDLDALREASQGADIMVHLAANTGVQPSIEDPLADMESNVRGTINALEAARSNGVKSFIFASSGAPIGRANPPLDEQALCRPISPYGVSKLAGESYCHAYHECYGLNTVSLRFSNVYGPLSGKKGSVVAKFLGNAFAGKPLTINGDGGQTRDFLYSRDLVRAVVAASEHNKGGELFQIATGTETTIAEVTDMLLRLLKEEAGLTPKIKHGPELTGDVRRNYAVIDKAKNVLGWVPEMDMEQGLRLTIRWFMQRNKG